MKCSKAQKLIPFLTNHELNEKQRREVEEHLRQCVKCQCLASQYAELARLARSMTKPNEPPDFYDNFFQQLLVQVSRDTPPVFRSTQKRFGWLALRPRYAWGGVCVLVALAIIGFWFSKNENQNHRMTMETYLIRRDFQGLAQALTDPQQRTSLMSDSVSADLLIGSLKRLDRIHRQHAQVGPYFAQVAARVLHQEQNLRVISAKDRNLSQSPPIRHPDLRTGKIDFKQAIRDIQSIKFLGAKITLKQLATAWLHSYKANSMKGGQTP